jgi:hypothetical protein
VETGPNGVFVLRDLPEGVLRLRIVIAGSNGTLADTMEVITRADSTARIDTISTRVNFSPVITFESTVGHAEDEEGSSVQQTSDGGYVVTGYVRTDSTNPDIYLAKYTANGDTAWTRTFGGAGWDCGKSVQQTSDGGFILTGDIAVSGPEHVCLLKTNGIGEMIWTKRFGRTPSDEGHWVQQARDGGYIIAGITGNIEAGEVYLIKTNGDGDTVWTKAFGRSEDNGANFVQQTADGGYIVTGYTYRVGRDVYLIKTDSIGDTVWTRTYGGVRMDEGCCVRQTSDGGYIVTGFTSSVAAGTDVYLVKTNGNGDLLWTRTYGGGNNEYGYCVRQTRDGGYILAGETGSFGEGMSDAYLIKTKSNGDTVWTRTFGGTGLDYANSVQQMQDGGYVLAGSIFFLNNRNRNIFLIKTDGNGNVK